MLSIKGVSGDKVEREDAPQSRRFGSPLLVSLAVNAVVLVVFFRAAQVGNTWERFFGHTASKPVAAERIGFVRLPTPAQPSRPAVAGGDGRSTGARGSRPGPAFRAPTTIPSTLPPVDASRSPATGAGTGPVIGGGGPTQGIVPSYGDPRVWAPPGRTAIVPKTAKERIDSVLTDRFKLATDSILAAQQIAAGQRAPGDWTVRDKNGNRWGMDQQAIRLGKVSIPNALLALLSSNMQQGMRSNPVEMENERRLASIRTDLLQHAQREMSEDEFRRSVQEIRRRKDRERATQSGATEPPVVVAPVAGQSGAAAP